MSTRAAHGPARARREHVPPPRPRPRTAPREAVRPRRVRRAGLRPVLLMIPVFAILLSGIVWINVSKLAFTAETGRVVENARVVEARNVRLKAQLDRVNATVVDRAQERLGMGVPSDGSVTPLSVPTP